MRAVWDFDQAICAFGSLLHFIKKGKYCIRTPLMVGVISRPERLQMQFKGGSVICGPGVSVWATTVPTSTWRVTILAEEPYEQKLKRQPDHVCICR